MPYYNTVKKIFEIKIEQYYLELTNIEFIDPVLNDMITNAQKHSIIPNLNETPLFKIYCILVLDACKITNPFIPSDDPVTSQTQNDVILSKKDELESLKQEVGFLDTESLCGLTPIQQLTFIKILLSANALINNSNFQNIDLYPPHCKSHESDDQIFAFAVLPHIFSFHSSIIHISTSADGHVHDMEMYKLIFLISKLQKFNYSITFICSDGETGLTKYHTAYFEKYIYENIPKLLSQNLDESITVCDMINLIFHNIPNCPPMPSFDVLNGCKSARTDKWFSFFR